MKFDPSKDTAYRRNWFTVGVAISLSAATFAKPLSTKMDEPWRSGNSSTTFGLQLDYRLGEIYKGSLSNAEVSRTPWTGPWWPSAKGSAAVRIGQVNDQVWGKDAAAFHNHHYSAEELVRSATSLGKNPNSSDVEIFEGGLLDTVSPMEKFDIASGHASQGSSNYYRHTRATLDFASYQLTHYANTAQWNGLCNGFASASIYLPEPRAVKRYSEIYTLSDGRKVQFLLNLFSGDLKGIATYQYAMETWDASSENIAGVIGDSCDQVSGVGCRGINAGSFHLLMTNLVARSRESLIFDIDASSAIWNYPVVGYRITQVSLRPYRNADGSATKWARGNAAASATHDVRVVMEVDYMGESDYGKYPWKIRNRDMIFTKTYEYLVELTPGTDGSLGNADDVIVGGEWLSKERPDIAWKLKRPYRFANDYKMIDPQSDDPAWTAAWQEEEWNKYWSSLNRR